MEREIWVKILKRRRDLTDFNDEVKEVTTSKSVGWIHLALDQWRAVVNTKMNTAIP